MVETDYLGCIGSLVELSACFVGAFALMLWYSPILTLVAIIAALLPMAASVIAGNKLEKAEKQVSDRNAVFLASLKYVLSGFTVIKSFNAEAAVRKLFGNVTQDTEGTKRHRDRLSSALKGLGMIAGVTAQMGVFLWGAYLAGEGKAVTPGIVMAFVNLMSLVIQPIIPGAHIACQAKGRRGTDERLAKDRRECAG